MLPYTTKHTFFTVSLLVIVLFGLTFASSSQTATLCPATGHYYDFVHTDCDDPWTDAKALAEAAGGYLATVTSAAEQLCMSTIQGGNWRAYWAGGSDAAVEGQWRWVTGPEASEDGGAGRQFWQGGPPLAGGTTTVPDSYANWFPPPSHYEPNNSGGNEDYLSWNTGSGVGGENNHWNDVPITNPAVCGYAVEFDSDPSGPPDADADGVPDDSDNCPGDPNPLQEDNDTDGAGDVCDDDDDNDGVIDLADNCPIDSNPLQEDFDVDGLGNACDNTFDGDPIVQEIEDLALMMRGLIVMVDPPGGNGMLSKLTGKGGVLAKVGNARTAFALGLIDIDTYLSELEDALAKLGAFDNQLSAKIGNGQIPEVTEGSELEALSGEVLAIIESLVTAAGG